MKPTELPSFPPYLPSAGWYARWLHHRLEGLSDTEAIEAANRDLKPRLRDMSRTRIAGRRDIVALSLPIQGGRSVALPDLLKVSAHGDWQRVHFGAIFSGLGKYPYFQEYSPEIESIYRSAEAGTPLSHINLRMHKAVAERILGDALIQEAKALLSSDPARAARLAKDYPPTGETDSSLLSTVMTFGPHTIFSLLYCLLDNEKID